MGIGGYDGQMRLKTVEVYNPFQSCRFQLQENRLNVRRSNFSVSVIEDKILVMGGYNGHGVTNRCEMFDEKTNIWSLTNPMEFKRSALESMTLDHFTLNYKEFV